MKTFILSLTLFTIFSTAYAQKVELIETHMEFYLFDVDKKDYFTLPVMQIKNTRNSVVVWGNSGKASYICIGKPVDEVYLGQPVRELNGIKFVIYIKNDRFVVKYQDIKNFLLLNPPITIQNLTL